MRDFSADPVPRELIEAAQMDGCSLMGQIRQVTGIVLVAVFLRGDCIARDLVGRFWGTNT